MGSCFNGGLRAVWQGLLLAWQRGCREIILEMDCQDAMSLLQGPNSLHPNLNLVLQMREFVKEWDCKIQHIFLEKQKSVQISLHMRHYKEVLIDISASFSFLFFFPLGFGHHCIPTPTQSFVGAWPIAHHIRQIYN